MSEASEERAGMTSWWRDETGEDLPPKKIIFVEIARFAAAPGDEVRYAWRV